MGISVEIVDTTVKSKRCCPFGKSARNDSAASPELPSASKTRRFLSVMHVAPFPRKSAAWKKSVPSEGWQRRIWGHSGKCESSSQVNSSDETGEGSPLDS